MTRCVKGIDFNHFDFVVSFLQKGGNNMPTKKQDKVSKVMHEWKAGTLKSGSGDKVISKKQAIAIGLNYGKKKR